jgi:hypothetical protein
VPFVGVFLANRPPTRPIGKLRHDANPMLSMCMSSVVVERDPADNRKLNKKRS